MAILAYISKGCLFLYFETGLSNEETDIYIVITLLYIDAELPNKARHAKQQFG
jgi:hypothetical protein